MPPTPRLGRRLRRLLAPTTTPRLGPEPPRRLPPRWPVPMPPRWPRPLPQRWLGPLPPRWISPPLPLPPLPLELAPPSCLWDRAPSWARRSRRRDGRPRRRRGRHPRCRPRRRRPHRRPHGLLRRQLHPLHPLHPLGPSQSRWQSRRPRRRPPFRQACGLALTTALRCCTFQAQRTLTTARRWMTTTTPRSSLSWLLPTRPIGAPS